MSRLAVRLTYGIPAAAVELAQIAGTELLRGDYCRLAAARLCEPDRIGAAAEGELLGCLDLNRGKLAIVLDAAERIAQRRARAQKVTGPVLEAYVA